MGDFILRKDQFDRVHTAQIVRSNCVESNKIVGAIFGNSSGVVIINGSTVIVNSSTTCINASGQFKVIASTVLITANTTTTNSDIILNTSNFITVPIFDVFAIPTGANVFDAFFTAPIVKITIPFDLQNLANGATATVNLFNINLNVNSSVMFSVSGALFQIFTQVQSAAPGLWGFSLINNTGVPITTPYVLDIWIINRV